MNAGEPDSENTIAQRETFYISVSLMLVDDKCHTTALGQLDGWSGYRQGALGRREGRRTRANPVLAGHGVVYMVASQGLEPRPQGLTILRFGRTDASVGGPTRLSKGYKGDDDPRI